MSDNGFQAPTTIGFPATTVGGFAPPSTAALAANTVSALPVAAVGGLAAAALVPSQGPRPSVIQLVFREKGALYAAYIPLLSEGGLFVPTHRSYRLGEDIYLLLSLPDDPQRYPVAGKVAWVTPANASGGRTQGVGVRFPGDEKTSHLKLKIEEILGTQISSSKPTQTV
jgi:type IV pilus assembly protein PilZ